MCVHRTTYTHTQTASYLERYVVGMHVLVAVEKRDGGVAKSIAKRHLRQNGRRALRADRIDRLSARGGLLRCQKGESLCCGQSLGHLGISLPIVAAHEPREEGVHRGASLPPPDEGQTGVGYSLSRRVQSQDLSECDAHSDRLPPSEREKKIKKLGQPHSVRAHFR
jgi:hypothetical protein